MYKKEGGFTILELVISVALIGVIIPSVYLSINSLLVINKRSRNIALTNLAAENKIESLRSIGYNNIPNGSSAFTDELPEELSNPNSATLNVSTSNGKKVVDISISFKDFNRQRIVQYKTIIGETGVGQ